MRIVTGTTVSRWSRETGMLLADNRRRMATQTEGVATSDQQVRMLGLMRLVAGGALPLGIRCMRPFEVAGQLCVTAVAGLSRPVIKQALVLGGVRVMTTETFPLAHRLMHHPTILRGRGISVTGIAKILDRLLQKTFKFGDVRAMAGAAVPGGDRFMTHSFFEDVLFVTGETVNSKSCPPGHQYQK